MHRLRKVIVMTKFNGPVRAADAVVQVGGRTRRCRAAVRLTAAAVRGRAGIVRKEQIVRREGVLLLVLQQPVAVAVRVVRVGRTAVALLLLLLLLVARPLHAGCRVRPGPPFLYALHHPVAPEPARLLHARVHEVLARRSAALHQLEMLEQLGVVPARPPDVAVHDRARPQVRLLDAPHLLLLIALLGHGF